MCAASTCPMGWILPGGPLGAQVVFARGGSGWFPEHGQGRYGNMMRDMTEGPGQQPPQDPRSPAPDGGREVLEGRVIPSRSQAQRQYDVPPPRQAAPQDDPRQQFAAPQAPGAGPAWSPQEPQGPQGGDPRQRDHGAGPQGGPAQPPPGHHGG